MVQPLQKPAWSFLKILAVELAWDPATPLLECFSKRMEVRISRDISAAMSLMALITRAEVEAPENALTPELRC